MAIILSIPVPIWAGGMMKLQESYIISDACKWTMLKNIISNLIFMSEIGDFEDYRRDIVHSHLWIRL